MSNLFAFRLMLLSLSPFCASEGIALRVVLSPPPASSLNESMVSINILLQIFIVYLTLILRRTTFGMDGPITDTFPCIRGDSTFSPGPNFS